jgi:ATP-binding cassette subfamily B protein
MMAVYAVCSLITGIGGSFCGSIAALLIAQNVRNGMYQKIQSLSFSDLDKVTTPSLITRMTNDVQKYQINMQLIITVLFRAPVTFCISLYNAFTLGGTTIYG